VVEVVVVDAAAAGEAAPPPPPGELFGLALSRLLQMVRSCYIVQLASHLLAHALAVVRRGSRVLTRLVASGIRRRACAARTRGGSQTPNAQGKNASK